MHRIEDDFKRYYQLRLLAATLLFGIGAVVYYLSGSPTRAFVSILVLAFVYLHTILYFLYARWFVSGKTFPMFFLLGIDLMLITFAVASTGGKASPYVFIYALLILLSAMVFSRRICYGVTMASWMLFLLVVIFHASFDVPSLSSYTEVLWKEMGFVFTYFNLAGFILIAALSGYLSERTRATGKALSEKSETLRTLQNLHENILQSISSGVISLDLSDRITSVNPAAVTILGVKTEHVLLGSSIDSILPELGVWKIGIPTRNEMQYRTPDDRDLILGCASSSLKGRGGEHIGRIIIFQDLTEVKELEEQLNKSQKLAIMGQLASGLAHEIRNPLATISGAIELLGGEIDDDSDTNKRLINVASMEVEKLNFIAGDFLVLTQGAQQDNTFVDVNRTLSEAVESFLIGYDMPGLTLETELAQRELYVLANQNRLKQVFWNLLQNARQAMPEGGTISIKSAAEAGKVLISISDTGMGISEDMLPRIFEPFYTTKEVGTGLGLAIVAKVVESLEGEVRVSSTMGAGTVVTVLLPQSEDMSGAKNALSALG